MTLSMTIYIFLKRFWFQILSLKLLWVPVIVLFLKPTAQGVVVQSIEIKGNQKIESGVVEEKIKNKKGLHLRLDWIRQEVRELFKTGFFQDIEVRETPGKEGVILTYILKEKPTIVSLQFKGHSAFNEEELKDLTSIKVFEVIDYNQIQKAISDMEKAYEEKGYYLAQLSYEVKPKGAGVEVIFNIEENDQVIVKRISFIGNNKVHENILKNYMQTKEGSIFSWFSDVGSFKKDVFEQDVRIIGLVYFNKGYVQAKVNRPSVTVTPDKKGIFISIPVVEGEQFDVGEVSFSGDLIFSTQDLMDAIGIDESKVFSYERVQSDIQKLTAKYGDKGYAYTNVIPRTYIRDKDRKVDIIYELDKGNKVYFGKITISGNTQTRDKVVRRELQIREGELYNETRKRESEDNVRRLGYFEKVQFNVKTPKGRDDVMDLDIVVTERNTGSFQVGAGYGTFSGWQLTSQFNQNNFLGRGQSLGLQVDYNRLQQRYSFNFTEPYFLDTFWSTGFSVFRNDNNFRGLFRETSQGVSVRLGHPIFNRYIYAFIRYRLDSTLIGTGFAGSENYPTDVFDASTVNGVTSSLTGTLEYDRRNDRFAPTRGIHTSLSYELAGLGGDISYTKGDAFFRWFYNVFWNVVLRTNFTYGFVASSGGRPIPFTKRYRLGGPFSLRAFDFLEVGQLAFSCIRYNYLKGDPGSQCPLEEDLDPDIFQRSQVVLGGAQQALAMVELEFPLVKEAGVRGVLFYDVGIAQDTLNVQNIGQEARQDVGFGVRWFSPMGPLRLEWGFPLHPRPGEDTSDFHFAIGSPF